MTNDYPPIFVNFLNKERNVTFFNFMATSVHANAVATETNWDERWCVTAVRKDVWQESGAAQLELRLLGEEGARVGCQSAEQN